MIEEEGIVVETASGNAKVEIVRKSACESCSAAGVCHPADDSYMDVVNPLGAVKGQKVKVVVAPQIYLKAAIVLYGVPVTSLIGGAIVGKILALRYVGEANSDLWAFLAGALCLVFSFFFIKWYNTRVEKTQKYKPEIVEILA